MRTGRGSSALLACLALSACQMALPLGGAGQGAAQVDAPVEDIVTDGAGEAIVEGGETPDAGEQIPPEVSKAGLFGFLRPKEPVGVEAEDAAFAPRPETLGVEQELTEGTPPQATPNKPGLFGFLAGGQSAGVEAPKSTVAPGEVLPFGTIGIACELKKRDMGKEIGQSPEKGRASWTVYDSDPQSTAPRSHFITGFADGCARQVTASLVMFGAAEFHEFLRYAEGNDAPWTDADKAYEKIKRQSCGVGRGTPCPAGQRGALDQNLAFVTIYPQFGGGSEWIELLLNAGELVSEERRDVE